MTNFNIFSEILSLILKLREVFLTFLYRLYRLYKFIGYINIGYIGYINIHS